MSAKSVMRSNIVFRRVTTLLKVIIQKIIWPLGRFRSGLGDSETFVLLLTISYVYSFSHIAGTWQVSWPLTIFFLRKMRVENDGEKHSVGGDRISN